MFGQILAKSLAKLKVLLNAVHVPTVTEVFHIAAQLVTSVGGKRGHVTVQKKNKQIFIAENSEY